MANPTRPAARTGRGAVSNPEGRFETTRVEVRMTAGAISRRQLPPLETVVRPDPARSIISRNKSPDIAFDQSINPYRGCEHGCIYCYARPSHGYLNLSPGLDFETRLFYKEEAARLLEQELAAPGYRCSPITIGANTDPYQPIEREYRVTRSILEVLARLPTSVLDHHQEQHDRARYRSAGAAGARRTGAGPGQRDDAQQRTETHARATHRITRRAIASHSHRCPRPACR